MSVHKEVPFLFGEFSRRQRGVFNVIVLDIVLTALLLFLWLSPSWSSKIGTFICCLLLAIFLPVTVLKISGAIWEWIILKNGVMVEAKIIDLVEDDDDERYNIEYVNHKNKKLTGSFVNYSPIVTESRTFQPRYKSGDTVLIVIDPYNPRKLIEWSGRYETV
jgi:hypothetical protein